MIYESHFKKNSFKIFLLYKSRIQQTVVGEDTLVVVSQSVLCVVFWVGVFFIFSLLAKSWQVQSGLISVVLYLSFFVSRTVWDRLWGPADD